LVRREVFSQIGLFDEDYFVYSEEVDFCERIRRKGWDLQLVPDAVITHLGGMSTRLVANEMFLELYRNKSSFSANTVEKGKQKHIKLFWDASFTRVIAGRFFSLFSTEYKTRWCFVVNNYQALLSILPDL